MKNVVVYDTDIVFSVEDGGIWINHNGKQWLLELTDCIDNMHEAKYSSGCVGCRDITKLQFILSSSPPTEIRFLKGILPFLRTKKTVAQRFYLLQKSIQSLEYTTYDLS